MNWLNGKGTYIGGVAAILHGLSAGVLDIIAGKFPDQMSIAEIIGGWTAIRMRMAL